MIRRRRDAPRLGCIVAALALVLAGASLARAQANDRSSPLGGRSALMGNTGIALGRDGAAPFLNPATIVGIDDRRLEFSANFLALQFQQFNHWHQPSAVDPRFGEVSLGRRSISSARLTGVPSTVCLFLSLSALKSGDAPPGDDPTPWKGGRQKFAVCLATLESEDLVVPAISLRAPTAAGGTSQDISLSRKWNRAQVGPSYSARVGDSLAFGASLQGAYSTLSFIQDASAITAASDGTAVQSSLGAAGNGYSFDLTAILGATYTVRATTFGASIQIPSLHVLGSYSASSHQSLATADGSAGALTRGSGTFRAPPPVRIAAGVGREFPGLMLEADASFDFGYAHAWASSMHVDSTTTNDGVLASSTFAATYSTRSQPVLNGSLGAEYFLSPNLSLLGGLWTNLSAFAPLQPLPAPSVGNLVQGRTSRVGLSLGLGSYGNSGELLFGTQLGYGWGQSIAADLYSVPNDWRVVSATNFSALFILAGSTNLRVIKGAIEGVKKVLTPESAPGP